MLTKSIKFNRYFRVRVDGIVTRFYRNLKSNSTEHRNVKFIFLFAPLHGSTDDADHESLEGASCRALPNYANFPRAVNDRMKKCQSTKLQSLV